MSAALHGACPESVTLWVTRAWSPKSGDDSLGSNLKVRSVRRRMQNYRVNGECKIFWDFYIASYSVRSVSARLLMYLLYVFISFKVMVRAGKE